MALPFIVGPHQCSLTHGPDGYPQVEITFRLKLPVAEFIDALLLTLAEQRPLFQDAESTISGVASSPTAQLPSSSRPKEEGKGAKSRGKASGALRANNPAALLPNTGQACAGIPGRWAKETLDVDRKHMQLLATLAEPTALATHPTLAHSPSPVKAAANLSKHGARSTTSAPPWQNRQVVRLKDGYTAPFRVVHGANQKTGKERSIDLPRGRARTHKSVLSNK